MVSTELVIVEADGGVAIADGPAPAVGLTPLDGLQEKVREYLREGKSANTRRAYKADFEHFVAWCDVSLIMLRPMVRFHLAPRVRIGG